MIYKVIGLMSGSSLDGLDIVFAELEENKQLWNYKISASECISYNNEWKQKLLNAKNESALNYLLLNVEYAKWLAKQVNQFIDNNNLHHQVQLIASHGHTVFHAPKQNMTAQLGDGATIAALTGINVVNDLRNMDVALNGQGAPIVPLGEKLLFPGYDFYLNIGGIANISSQQKNNFIAFDVCPANRVLNMLSISEGKEFDEDGNIASSGNLHQELFDKLNELNYYDLPFPKSLSNDFGVDVIFPLIQSFNLSTKDALRTYTEHIAFQISNSIKKILRDDAATNSYKLLATGGGAFNKFLMKILQEKLIDLRVSIVLPEKAVVEFKEALVMALLGVLRWREENTVLSSVTGATRSSIGGAVWIGQEA